MGPYKNRNLKQKRGLSAIVLQFTQIAQSPKTNRTLKLTDLYRLIQSGIESETEHRIGIGRSVNRIFRPPLLEGLQNGPLATLKMNTWKLRSA
jgi:hypothetical protein